MAVEIRRAGPSDVTKALELRRRLFAETPQGKGKEISAEQEWRGFHDVLGFLLDPGSVLLLAEEDKKAIGMLALHNGPLVGYYQEPTVSVTWLYIVPEHRNRGLLLKMIRLAEQAVIPGKEIIVHATVRRDNDEVMDGLSKMGYYPIAVVLEKRHGKRNKRTAAVP